MKGKGGGIMKYEAFPTMITPYGADGTVDLETVKKYVRWYHDTGCHGIFAVCQSSEIFYLSEEELVAINRTVWETVQEIAAEGGRKMTVVSSGHVASDIDAQAKTLCRIAQSGTDALILITNRLDLHNEGDDVWIANAEKLLTRLPADVKLGLYECPHPYKRLLTPRILRWCIETGRFAFIKDTCCDVATMKERCEILKGSGIRLFNANCQTLSASMKNGSAGYCGIMCNFHPELYVWLCENFEKDHERVEKLQQFLTLCGFTENGLPYPLTAKHHMGLSGIPTENYARNVNPRALTDYAKFCVEQMKAAADDWKKKLGL
jgi:4-hydroxy-tetrahydrodipicolinate synthase